jgi:hypothetical protein
MLSSLRLEQTDEPIWPIVKQLSRMNNALLKIIKAEQVRTVGAVGVNKADLGAAQLRSRGYDV